MNTRAFSTLLLCQILAISGSALGTTSDDHHHLPSSKIDCGAALSGGQEPEKLKNGKVRYHIPHGMGDVDLTVNESVFAGPYIFSYRLVQEAIMELPIDTPLKILVVGTGGGFEAIALAKSFPKAQIEATDIAKAAVDLTAKNAVDQGVGKQIHAKLSDLFDQVDGQYDAILFSAPRPVTDVDLARHYAPELQDLRRQEMAQGQAFFDLDAKLLTRFLASFQKHLSPKGMVFLMTDTHMKVPPPTGFRAEALTVDPWGSTSKISQTFSIQKISRY